MRIFEVRHINPKIFQLIKYTSFAISSLWIFWNGVWDDNGIWIDTELIP